MGRSAVPAGDGVPSGWCSSARCWHADTRLLIHLQDPGGQTPRDECAQGEDSVAGAGHRLVRTTVCRIVGAFARCLMPPPPLQYAMALGAASARMDALRVCLQAEVCGT